MAETDKQGDKRSIPDRGDGKSKGPEVGRGIDKHSTCHTTWRWRVELSANAYYTEIHILGTYISIAALPVRHKLSHWKQQKTILWFYRLEVQPRSHGLKSRVTFLPDALGYNPYPYPSWLLEAPTFLGLGPSSSDFKANRGGPSPSYMAPKRTFSWASLFHKGGC